MYDAVGSRERLGKPGGDRSPAWQVTVARSRSSSQLIFAGKVFSVRRHSVVEPGGVQVTWEIVHHGGSAVILPRLPDGRILLIRQYRLAVGKFLWELPAGTIDKGEAALQTARRELAEETGYRSRSWRKLLEFYPSPGFVDEKMSLFLADDVRPGPPHTEEDEKILVRPYSMTEALRLVRTRKIVDAKSLVGLLYFERWGS